MYGQLLYLATCLQFCTILLFIYFSLVRTLQDGKFNLYLLCSFILVSIAGQALKQQVDEAIDICSQCTNLREAIDIPLETQSTGDRPELAASEKRRAYHLERYFSQSCLYSIIYV